MGRVCCRRPLIGRFSSSRDPRWRSEGRSGGGGLGPQSRQFCEFTVLLGCRPCVIRVSEAIKSNPFVNSGPNTLFQWFLRDLNAVFHSYFCLLMLFLVMWRSTTFFFLRSPLGEETKTGEGEKKFSGNTFLLRPRWRCTRWTVTPPCLACAARRADIRHHSTPPQNSSPPSTGRAEAAEGQAENRARPHHMLGWCPRNLEEHHRDKKCLLENITYWD